MQIIIALFRRWFHCLLHMHCGVSLWVDDKYAYIGCECGKHYYKAFNPEIDWDEAMQKLKKKAERR